MRVGFGENLSDANQITAPQIASCSVQVLIRYNITYNIPLHNPFYVNHFMITIPFTTTHPLTNLTTTPHSPCNSYPSKLSSSSSMTPFFLLPAEPTLNVKGGQLASYCQVTVTPPISRVTFNLIILASCPLLYLHAPPQPPTPILTLLTVTAHNSDTTRHSHPAHI